MLESPMPFFAGLQMREGEFLEDVYPKMKNSQKNVNTDTISVFVICTCAHQFS